MTLQFIQTYNKESGGVFFYILLAISLLAALSFAVNRGRSNLSIMTDQQAKLAAQEIIEYGNAVAAAVQKLKLRGIDDTEISFGNTIFSAGYNAPGHNPNCTSNACEIFSSEGGGISPIIMSEQAHTSFNSNAGQSWFKTIRISNVGSTEPDLVMQIQHIREEVCIKINNLLGVSALNTPPVIDSFDYGSANGSYAPLADPLGDVATELAGAMTHCAASNSTGYRFHQVLIAR